MLKGLFEAIRVVLRRLPGLSGVADCPALNPRDETLAKCITKVQGRPRKRRDVGPWSRTVMIELVVPFRSGNPPSLWDVSQLRH
jgi:hypothetical protein